MKYSLTRKTHMKNIQDRLDMYTMNSLIKTVEFANKYSLKLAIFKAVSWGVISCVLTIVALIVIF